jgi:hypothetical protein
MAQNIGFDFDDCIVQGYSLMPLILLLERILIKELKTQSVTKDVQAQLLYGKEQFYERLALNEFETKGILVRPSFFNVIQPLLRLKKAGKIDSMFIYSNNSSIDIINVCDHIIALTLKHLEVPDDHLIRDELGVLHTLTPRIHRDAACRSSEPLDSGNFKEKTFNGIQTCLGKNIGQSDLWFLDDTVDHRDLINKIQGQYIETRKYQVIMKNSKLAEFLVRSFPKAAFNPLSEIGKIFMSAYNKLEKYFIIPAANKNPTRFNPKGTESEESLIELLSRSLNAISPNAKGNIKSKWSAAETAADTSLLMTMLDPVFTPKATKRTIDTVRAISTATAYREPIGGKRTKTRRRKGQTT